MMGQLGLYGRHGFSIKVTTIRRGESSKSDVVSCGINFVIESGSVIFLLFCCNINRKI